MPKLGASTHLLCLQAWSIWHFYLICMTLRACAQLIIEIRVVCCLLQVVKVTPLDHPSTGDHSIECCHIFIKISFPNGNTKLNPPRKKPSSSKEKEVRKHWKAKICVSNHICLKQDKMPQHSHNETHDTLGLATNQIQPSRQPKHTEPTSTS